MCSGHARPYVWPEAGENIGMVLRSSSSCSIDAPRKSNLPVDPNLGAGVNYALLKVEVLNLK